MTLSATDIVVIVLCTVIGAFLIAGVCIIVYLKHVRVSVRPTGQRGQFGIFVCMLLYSLPASPRCLYFWIGSMLFRYIVNHSSQGGMRAIRQASSSPLFTREATETSSIAARRCPLLPLAAYQVEI